MPSGQGGPRTPMHPGQSRQRLRLGLRPRVHPGGRPLDLPSPPGGPCAVLERHRARGHHARPSRHRHRDHLSSRPLGALRLLVQPHSGQSFTFDINGQPSESECHPRHPYGHSVSGPLRRQQIPGSWVLEFQDLDAGTTGGCRRSIAAVLCRPMTLNDRRLLPTFCPQMIKGLTAVTSGQALDLLCYRVAPTGFEPALPP